MAAGPGGLNLLKLCVGAESVADLAEWQKTVEARRRQAGLDRRPAHVTRMWPRRADELLAGGSLYWVIKGTILVRQRIDALEPHEGEDGITRCAIVLDPALVRVEPRARSPFQGWRYLKGQDAPRDLARQGSGGDGALPPDLEIELGRLGVGAR